MRVIVGAIAALVLCAGTALAQDAPLSYGPARGATPSDASEVRSVIDAEIGALRRDDGEAAYALSAPEAKRRFPTVDGFMTMVRRGYAPLYRPESYRFGALRVAGATATQGQTLSQDVEVEDADGTAWVATFMLERQPDGGLGITACVLVRRGAATA